MPAAKPKPLSEQEYTEARIQQNCLVWLNKFHRDIERWLFSVPNGAYTDTITAARLKATGLKAGVSDMLLPEPRGIYHSLFLELKTPTGVLSPKQKEFIHAMRYRGFCVVVLDTLEAFQALMHDYLALQPGESLPTHHYSRWPLGSPAC